MRPTDCRAARALLNLTREDLASRSGVAVTTIEAFERDTHPIRYSSAKHICEAFKSFGVVFLDDEDGIGVRRSHQSCVENFDGGLNNPSIGDRRKVTKMEILNPRLVRAARALLGLDQKSASARMGISVAALNDIESEKTTAQKRTASKILTMLREHGVSLSREKDRLSTHLRISNDLSLSGSSDIKVDEETP